MSTRLHRSFSEKVFTAFNVAWLTLASLICLYPFYFVLIYSLSDPLSAAKGIYFLPAGFTLQNYATIFQLPNLSTAALISVSRTVLGAFITVFCCAFFGYLLTKEDLPGKKIIYRFTVITMYLSAGLIPWYIVIRMYGLSNTFWLYVIPTALSAFYIILFKTFIEQLPSALEESARIDGAGYMTVFFKIILPLSIPILATITVFAAVGQWNSYFDNYIFVTNPKLQTLQYILFTYLRRAEVVVRDADALAREMAIRQIAAKPTPMSVRMTITMVVTLPVLFIYPFAQRYFIKGILLGAIKG